MRSRSRWIKWVTLLLLPLMGVALAAQQFGNFLGIGQSGVPAAYQLDIRDATNRTGFHIRSNATTDTGGYIPSEQADEMFVSGGVAFDGTNWIAKAGTAGIFGQSGGILKFFEDGTLTPGNPYTPTERFRIGLTSAIFSNLSSVRPLSGATTDLGTASFTFNNIFTNVGLVDAAGLTRYSTPSNATSTITGTMADGATAIGTTINTSVTYANAAAKLLDIQNNAVEKAFVDLNGNLTLTGGVGIGAQSPATQGVQPSGSTTRLVTPSGALLQLLDAAGNTFMNAGNSATTAIASTAADGASAVSVSLNSANAFANATAKLLSVRNATVEKLAVDLNGKLIIPTAGGAAIVGTATLSAGTVTVSTTAVTASSKIFLTRATTGSNLIVGIPEVGSIVAGTSFVIQSITAVGGIAGDNGQINWIIVN